MRVRFNVFCHTEWGQEVYVLGTNPELGNWDLSRARKMTYSPGHVWRTEVALHEDPFTAFNYKYLIRNEAGALIREETGTRTFDAGMLRPVSLEFADTWDNPSDPDSLFRTAPFVETIFRHDAVEAHVPVSGSAPGDGPLATVRLKLVNPRVRSGDTVCVVGNIEPLGGWDSAKGAPMDPSGFPYWTLDLILNVRKIPFQYKYVIKDCSGEIVAYEDGPERSFEFSGITWASEAGEDEVRDPQEAPLIMVTDNKFGHKMKWRGAGIAVPVFSIRSDEGLGVGEFLDLKGLADWARETGFQLIQMLPINDTTAYMDWMDSYPYSCISVFALHPLYLNLEAMGPLPDGMTDEIASHRSRLNASPVLEFEQVMTVKRALFRKIFEAKKDAFLASPELRAFLQDHGHWLKSYAAFSALRDYFRTGDFFEWGPYAQVTEEDIDTLTTPGSEHYETVAFYYFLQYHLHVQLSDAARYARERGVVLKGDIPIGIQKRSDSCWINPGLFHMDQSAGAPPDPFSDSGQNWGFPTYNWGEMARDNFSWWRNRMGHMAHYFQMIRLDHILGFFRIWEIPDDSYSGLMGHFNPALTLRKEEFESEGIWDLDRLKKPYIPGWLVKIAFGREASRVTAQYLSEDEPGHFTLKPEFGTQRQVARHLSGSGAGAESGRAYLERVEDGLFSLISDIILFEDTANSGFHPRINMMDTASFASLDGWMKEKLMRLYYDYFYHRQEGFWREQAMVRLPVLKRVSNMLIAGEDLGMIPDCVPGVMEELCILGLRIQRMPKESDREFGYPWEYSYLTVAATSSHDMSTMRGWWEEDRARTTRYYHVVLGREGEPPLTLEPHLSQQIIRQHLDSPSMWAVFPIQDVLAMSAGLRRPGNPVVEQINVPAEPNHLWNYRVHITTGRLLDEKEFNAQLRKMIADSGRDNPY